MVGQRSALSVLLWNNSPVVFPDPRPTAERWNNILMLMSGNSPWLYFTHRKKMCNLCPIFITKYNKLYLNESCAILAIYVNILMSNRPTRFNFWKKKVLSRMLQPDRRLWKSVNFWGRASLSPIFAPPFLSPTKSEPTRNLRESVGPKSSGGWQDDHHEVMKKAFLPIKNIWPCQWIEILFLKHFLNPCKWVGRNISQWVKYDKSIIRKHCFFPANSHPHLDIPTASDLQQKLWIL